MSYFLLSVLVPFPLRRLHLARRPRHLRKMTPWENQARKRWRRPLQPQELRQIHGRSWLRTIEIPLLRSFATDSGRKTAVPESCKLFTITPVLVLELIPITQSRQKEPFVYGNLSSKSASKGCLRSGTCPGSRKFVDFLRARNIKI